MGIGASLGTSAWDFRPRSGFSQGQEVVGVNYRLLPSTAGWMAGLPGEAVLDLGAGGAVVLGGDQGIAVYCHRVLPTLPGPWTARLLGV